MSKPRSNRGAATAHQAEGQRPLSPPGRGQGEGQVQTPPVVLRPAEPRDSHRVWTLRNDPDTRRVSFDTAVVPWETHAAWFARSLTRADRKIFIVDLHGSSAGVARLDIAGGEAAVSIHLAPEWRGHGLGPVALEQLATFAFRDLGLSRLIASIKPDNAPSLAAFTAAGFTQIEAGGVVTLERRR